VTKSVDYPDRARVCAPAEVVRSLPVLRAFRAPGKNFLNLQELPGTLRRNAAPLTVFFN